MDTIAGVDAVEVITEKLTMTDPSAFHLALSFPTASLDAVSHRLLSPISKLELNLFTDIFNVNQFHSGSNGAPDSRSLREFNCCALVSELIDDVPFQGWDAARAVLTDALSTIPGEVVNIQDMQPYLHRLRSAVLVNIIVDRSDRMDSYSRTVDYFEKNFDAIYACYPALIERHEGLSEVNLEIVDLLVNGGASSLAEGTL